MKTSRIKHKKQAPVLQGAQSRGCKIAAYWKAVRACKPCLASWIESP